ncbi:FkbM family methyltransferase [Mangrovimonas cancribranchiae]|uniref:FkbM family methyltransferase n=1 Tax=Mangrovimonas cancribranchiae TaxID=3080055 RepID=A0AAU6P1K2_9FLAO
MEISLYSFIKNYKQVFLASISKVFGRGKYYRKRLFDLKRILEKNYPQKSDFNFIQVGANDGVSFDFLYHFVIKRNCSGVVIEPIAEYFEELLENYKDYENIIKVRTAVHNHLKSVQIYKIDNETFHLYPKWVKGIASFQKSNLTKFEIIKPEHIIKETVLAAPLMKIIDLDMFQKVDYFQVDTEGYDFEIINMIDFTKINPKIIKAEYVNLNEEDKISMEKFLKLQGYFVFKQGLDLVGIKLNKVIL